jgi:menaquinone-dependent protoporphyrinogen oxidase
VLGAGIYIGRMHADVRKLLRRHRAQLAARPLAVFALGPIGDLAKQLPEVRRRVDAELAKLTEVPPVTVAVFGGVVAPERMRFPFSRMQPFDGRDWREIRDWSRALASTLGRDTRQERAGQAMTSKSPASTRSIRPVRQPRAVSRTSGDGSRR